MIKIGAWFLILTLLISGCGFHTSISKIRYEPGKYEGKEVSIKGRVSETIGIPLIQKGAYQVDDGSGKIWVLSQKRRPSRGEKVTVKGKVKTGVSIRGYTLGLAIVEGDEKK